MDAKLKWKQENLIISGVVVTVLVWVADWMLPLGVAGGVPYIVPVLIGLLYPGRRYIIIATVSGCVLTIFGYYFSPEGGELWKVLANRFLAVFAILMTGMLCLYYKQLADELLRKNQIEKLLMDVATAANETSSFSYALQACLTSACKVTGWPVGHMYSVDEKKDKLYPTFIWYLDDPVRFNNFKEITDQTTFDAKAGLPGRVLASGKPVWIKDVTADDNFPRAKLAGDIGVKSGIGIPVKSGNEIIGVLEFYSDKIMEPEPELIEVLSSIGTQLGRVAERERSAERLRRAHDELEKRVEERTLALSETVLSLEKEINDRKLVEKRLAKNSEELRRSNQALQDFATIASHDLQEPLRKVLILGDQLKHKFSGELGESGQDLLDRMHYSALRMRNFIDDLLEYSKVNLKPPELVPLDLNRLVPEVLNDLEMRIHQTQARIEMGPMPVIEADEFQMRQLFMNLISNAIKYHRKEVPPVINIQCENGGADYKITLQDNGIGFDPKYSDKIFKPFERLHGASEFEGNGMGLAICRKIVERHGGRLSADSVQGEGSVFTITLPKKNS